MARRGGSVLGPVGADRTRLVGWAVASASVLAVVGVIAAAGRFPDGDMGHLVGVELRLAQLLRAGEWTTAARLGWALLAPQPPLGYLPGVATYAVLGSGLTTAPLVMGVSLLLAWDALWRAWGPRAWAAWLPIVCSPFVWVAVEQHSRDLVAAAVLLQTLTALARARGFRDRPAAVAFGAWLGVGFMTKYTLPAYFVLACLGAGLPLLAAAREERAARWANLGVSVAAFLVPAGAWYALRGADVHDYVTFSFGADLAASTSNYRDPSSIDSMAYYPLALRDALSAPGVALVLVALVAGVSRAADRARIGLAALAALGGLGILSTAPAAVDRHALPAFFALAATLPALLPTAPTRLGWIAAGVIAVVFLPQGNATVFRFLPGAPVRPAIYAHPVATVGRAAWPYPPTYYPSDLGLTQWRLADAVRAIREAHGRDDGTIGVLGAPVPGGAPTFTTLLVAASAQGFTWDYATVNTRPGPGRPDVFVGPLFDGSFPPSTFTTVYVVRTTPPDDAAERWLRDHRAVELARFPGPDRASTAVVRVER